MKKFFLITILLLLLGGLLLPFLGVDAAFNLMEGVCKDGDCTVCDVLLVFYNVAKFIFISMSGIALILIIWAGIGLIMNWGIAEEVAKNKKIILHTILAVVIILMAWTLVGAIGWEFLGAKESEFWGRNSTTGQLNWWTGPTCE